LAKRNVTGKTKADLSEKLDVEDMGTVSEFLSTNVRTSSTEIEIDQQSYIETVLNAFPMGDCRGAVAPLERGCIVQDRYDEQKFSESLYRAAVGCLICH